MIYLAGDNNLSGAGPIDLAEMRRVGSSADVNLLAQFDSPGDAGARRYRIERGGLNEQAEALGVIDSGDPQVLSDFIGWSVEKFPAERYALVLWNHGGGWAPTEMDRVARSVNAQQFTVREANERAASRLGRVLFRTSLEKIFSLPTPAERAICSDDCSGHSLDTLELSSVLERAVGVLGRPFDLLGMDACLMSNLEVAYEVQAYVRYIVASEENEPAEGWPYDRVLQQIVDHPDLPTGDLAAHIVNSYIDSYLARHFSGPVTQSAFDLSRIDQVAGPLDELVESLLGLMPDVSYKLWQAQRRSASFFYATLWDIGQFCEELEKQDQSDAVKQATQKVAKALQAGKEQFVIAEAHSGPTVARCCGVNIYLQPPLLSAISRYYADLQFAKKHRWLDLLKAYHAA
jgi:hypothetical protein